jgi:hypothetical protein
MAEREWDVEHEPAQEPLFVGSLGRLRRHRHFENENCGGGE